MVQQSPESTCLALTFLQKLVIYIDKTEKKKYCCHWRKGERLSELAKSGRRTVSEPGAEITSPEDSL